MRTHAEKSLHFSGLSLGFNQGSMSEKTREILGSFDLLRVDLGLGRIKAFLEELGNPEKKMKYVHVAGTNGKGSTCAFIASALAEAGCKTGLYTSPHLLDFRERFQVNGKSIKSSVLEQLAGNLMKKKEESAINLSYFEFITAMAFEYFAEENCEYVVLEVGMGGRLDATNVITPEASVITPISLEHREFLGSTIEKIAAEKAGIIKAGIPVVSAKQESRAMGVIEKKSSELNASLSVFTQDFNYAERKATLQGQEFDYSSEKIELKGLKTRMVGEHQFENASLSVRTLELLGVEPGAIRRGLEKAVMPGRFQIIHNKPGVVVDVAHNAAGARALRKSLEGFFPGKKAQFVLGVSRDKDVGAIASELVPVAESFVCTQASFRGMQAERVASAVKKTGFKGNVYLIPNPGEAAVFALGQKPALAVLTGSFFSVAEELAALNSGTNGKWVY